MTEVQRGRFYEDILAIVDLHQPTYVELMEAFSGIILTQEMILEEGEDEHQ